jgi:acyl phosphate:glycerol-3-phosphate acyltransferase
MPSLAITAVLSYLLGSIPFGYILVRLFRGEDVRQSGSGNIGATNVSRKSPVLGAMTLFLDAIKGAVAVLIGMTLCPVAAPHAQNLWYHNLLGKMAPSVAGWAATAALFAILGHMFPVWLKFRGGKGVATGLGSFLMIAPKAVLVAAIVFVAVVIISRYVSLGSILAVLLFPMLVWKMYAFGSPWTLVLLTASSLLIVAKHHENIQRILARTENRIGSGRK